MVRLFDGDGDGALCWADVEELMEHEAADEGEAAVVGAGAGEAAAAGAGGAAAEAADDVPAEMSGAEWSSHNGAAAGLPGAATVGEGKDADGNKLDGKRNERGVPYNALD
jgi:hypothetical protein